MRVDIYRHRKSVDFPNDAEIIQGTDGSWIAYLNGDPVGSFGRSFEALSALRRIEPGLPPKLEDQRWSHEQLPHHDREGG